MPGGPLGVEFGVKEAIIPGSVKTETVINLLNKKELKTQLSTLYNAVLAEQNITAKESLLEDYFGNLFVVETGKLKDMNAPVYFQFAPAGGTNEYYSLGANARDASGNPTGGFTELIAGLKGELDTLDVSNAANIRALQGTTTTWLNFLKTEVKEIEAEDTGGDLAAAQAAFNKADRAYETQKSIRQTAEAAWKAAEKDLENTKKLQAQKAKEKQEKAILIARLTAITNSTTTTQAELATAQAELATAQAELTTITDSLPAKEALVSSTRHILTTEETTEVSLKQKRDDTKELLDIKKDAIKQEKKAERKKDRKLIRDQRAADREAEKDARNLAKKEKARAKVLRNRGATSPATKTGIASATGIDDPVAAAAVATGRYETQKTTLVQRQVNPSYIRGSDLTPAGEIALQRVMDCDCNNEAELQEQFGEFLSMDSMKRLNTIVVHCDDLTKEGWKEIVKLTPNRAEKRYLKKYFSIIQKENKGKYSKADVIREKAKMNEALYKKTMGTVKEIRMAKKSASNYKDYQADFKKYAAPTLQAVRCAEALKEQNDWLTTMSDHLLSDNVGLNPVVASPTMSLHSECPGMQTILKNPNSQFRKECAKFGLMNPKDIGDFFKTCGCDGIDFGMLPTINSAGYNIDINGKTVDPFLHGGVAKDRYENCNVRTPMRETYPNDLLIGNFTTMLQSKIDTGNKEYPNGYLPLFQEIAKRQLENRNGFDFYELTKSYPDNKELLDEVLYTLIDESVIRQIRTDMIGYADSDKLSLAQKNAILGHLVVDALSDQHHLMNKPMIENKLQTQRGGQWTQYQNSPNQNAKGNYAVGERVHGYVANKLNRGNDWLTKSLSAKDYLISPKGGFNGISNAFDTAVRNLATTLGVDKDKASLISALLKGGAILGGIGFAWKFWKTNIRNGSFGNNLWNIAKYGGGAYIGSSLVFNKSPVELMKYVRSGDPEGKGLFSKGPGRILKYFGYKGDMLAKSIEEVEADFTVGNIFSGMTFTEMSQYISMDSGKFTMTEAQAKAFLNDKSIPEYNRKSLAVLIDSMNNNFECVSEYLTKGMVASGVSPDYNDRGEILADPDKAGMTFDEYQRSRAEIKRLQKEYEEIYGDKAAELIKIRSGMSTAEKLAFDNRAKEYKEFLVKFNEINPYLYHLVERKDSFIGKDNTTPVSEIYGTTTTPTSTDYVATLLEYTHVGKADSDEIARGDKIKNAAFEYVKGSYGAVPGGFLDYYITSLDQPGISQPAVQTYIKDMYSNSSKLASLKAYEVPSSTMAVDTFTMNGSNKWRAGRDTVGTEYNEVLLNKIPGLQGGIETMIRIGPSASSTPGGFSFFVKENNYRQEYILEKIYKTDVKIDGLSFDPLDPDQSVGDKLGMHFAPPADWQYFDKEFLAVMIASVDGHTEDEFDVSIANKELSDVTKKKYFDWPGVTSGVPGPPATWKTKLATALQGIPDITVANPLTDPELHFKKGTRRSQF